MIKSAVAALKKLDKLPPDPKDLPEAIKKYLIDAGIVDSNFTEVFKRVITMRKMLDEDKVKDLPQREVEFMREYVRRFVQEISPVLEGKMKQTRPAKSNKKPKSRS